MALLTARGNVPPRGTMSADGLCRAFLGTTRRGDAQRGVMVAPWLREGWEEVV
jgi:superkiller protein 3